MEEIDDCLVMFFLCNQIHELYHVSVYLFLKKNFHITKFLTKFGQICNLFYLHKALFLVGYNIEHNFNLVYLCDLKVMAKDNKSENKWTYSI